MSTDELNLSKKGIMPVHCFEQRVAIIGAIRHVDDVFAEHSLEQKRHYLLACKADVLVMGDDWAGRFDEFSDIVEVVYLSRTPEISTTNIKQQFTSSNTCDAVCLADHVARLANGCNCHAYP